MKIYNAFGIKPTNNFVSAGSDYYIPHITTDEQAVKALDAFKKSYKVDDEELNDLVTLFTVLLKVDKYNVVDIVHLYLALYDPILEEMKDKDDNVAGAVNYFINEHLIYDASADRWGLQLFLNNTIFINSGIKVALPTANTGEIGIAGLYVNKSGMGNKGFDIRACLIDEDYSGYVHLSFAYTKEPTEYNEDMCQVFCGDKIAQMVLIPVFHTDYDEVDETEYNKLMEGSKRGDDGFGSSDIKH